MQDANPAAGEQPIDSPSNEPETLGWTTERLEQWLPESVQPIWHWLSDNSWIGAIVIILFGFAFARVLMFVLRRIVSQFTKRTKTDIDDQLLSFLSRPVFLTIFYASLGLAMISLKLPEAFTGTVIRVLLSLTVLVWMGAAFKISGLLLDTLGHFKDKFEIVQERTIPLFDMITKVLMVGLAGYLLLQVWNIDATAWLASAGVVGIAVGFAARDTLANLFAGVFIVVDAPYKIGDFVNLDSGERGMVTHVGLRSTRLLTRDDIEITIPNAVLANEKIVNESSGRWVKRRLRIKTSVAYGSDAEQVVALLMQIAADHPDVAAAPKARVRLRELGDSGLHFELLCWISEPVYRGKVTHELLMDVYARFQHAGIEIPFPQTDVHIRSATNQDTESSSRGDN